MAGDWSEPAVDCGWCIVVGGALRTFAEHIGYLEKMGTVVRFETEDCIPKNWETMNMAKVIGISEINVILVALICSIVFCQAAIADTAEKGQNQNSNASVTNVDIQELLGTLDNVKSVSLSMIQPFTESRVARTESEVEQSECQYSTDDMSLVTNMVDIIKNGGIHAYSGPKESWEPSELILLTLTNGHRIRFVFGWPFPAEKEIHGSINSSPVLAKLSLIHDLYRWAKTVKKIQPCDAWLDRNIAHKF